jgi:hypothetical protein
VGAQALAGALVVCGGSGSESGLTMDQVHGSTYGLGYIWGGNNYGISPATDFGMPTMPDSTWCYAALVIRPTSAEIYMCDSNNYGNWVGITNTFNVNHAAQAFSAPTLIGGESGVQARAFNGSADEVAIWGRALSQGELFTQYATGIGGVPPKLFNDLNGPTAPVAVGDPFSMTLDVGGSATLTYTWRKGGTPIAATTINTFTIASAALTDSGSYDCVVTNTSGTLTSGPLSVSVVNPTLPSITSSSGMYNRTLYPTGTLAMAVSATGGGLKYLWFKGNVAIPGATTSAYTVAHVTSANAGSYGVQVTNSVGLATNGPAVISVAAVGGGSYEALIVAANPEAWWRLGETNGLVMYDAMGRHDGVYTNTTAAGYPTLGAAGALSADSDTSVSFTANGGAGLAPFSPALNPQIFSMEAWLNTTVLNTTFIPFGSFDPVGQAGVYGVAIGGWWYGGFGSPGVTYFGNNGNVNTGGQIQSGIWSHLVVMYDGTRIISGTHYPGVVYVNGATDGFVWGGPSAGVNATAPFIIGGRWSAAAGPIDGMYNGLVDEVAFYGRSLTSTEVVSHFNGRFGSTTAPYFIGEFLPQTVTVGKSLSYSAAVYGSVPITVGWRKNGVPIAGATTTTLNLTNVQVSDSGTYSLWATNTPGTASKSVSVTVIPLVAYANATNNLVLHLRFDGNTSDTSGRGNNGTAGGNPNPPGYVTGIIGPQAIELISVTNGAPSPYALISTNWVDLGAPADLMFGASTSFSIAHWIKTPTNANVGDTPFIGTATNSNNNQGWDLSPTYYGGGWQWCIRDAAGNQANPSGGVINDGSWHHFAMCVDRVAQTAYTYLDGVLVDQMNVATVGNIDNPTESIVLGQDPTHNYTEAADFMMDDLGVWRRALSALEVAKIWSAGVTAGRSFDTVAPPVTLTVTHSGANLVLTWSAGTLLQSDSLGAGAVWTQVTGATSPYTFAPTASKKFFRVFVQ